MRFTTGTGPADPGHDYDTEGHDMTLGRLLAFHRLTEAMREVQPVPADPDLYARTAPAWTCITSPHGPHYLDTAGGCQWCGKTREEITSDS